MGGNLSVQETAYKQLSRDLKSQGDDYMRCINTFLQNFEEFETEYHLPPLQAKNRNTPHLLIECLQSEIRGSKINGENVYSILLAIKNVMCISNAYTSAAENPGEVIETLLDIIRKRDNLSAKCVAAAINAIRTIIFRRFCNNQSKYDDYQEAFYSALTNARGSIPIASCLNWERDENYMACEAACAFFNNFLNSHRSSQTCSTIAYYLHTLSSSISYLSILTTKCTLEPIQLLLKSILLCSSRDDLHKYQILFLQNGSFLNHLNQAVLNSKSEFSQEFVAICVADSAEGYRVLTRIFPTPLTKKLDIAMGSIRLKGVSYDEPLVETGEDTKVYENMALSTVFIPLRANWSGFWKSLSLTNQTYNFIWNAEMRDYLLSAIHNELEDIRVQEEKGSVSWDYDGFRIVYPQLEEFICVDGYYLQQMIDAFVAMETSEAKVELIKPVDFIRNLCDAIIVSRDLEEKRGMFYLIYQVVKLEDAASKDFPIMRYICYLLEEKELDPVLEYYCMHILDVTCKKQRNTEQFVDYNGLQCLTMTLLYYIQYLVTEQPPVYMESSRYNIPALTICYLDRIRLIIHIIKHCCDSMLRIRNELINEPILSRLLRCLLAFRDEVVTKDILSILSLSLASPTKYQSTIYKSGIFRILLNTSCSNGMSNEIAQLLYQYHSVQETTDVQNVFDCGSESPDSYMIIKNKTVEQRVEYARKFSYLRFFLPTHMIALLTREGPSAFKEVFNSQSTIRPDVIWDEECRRHLFDQTYNSLIGYTAEITKDPSVEWKYTVPEPVTYQKIEEYLVVFNVFLDCYQIPSMPLPTTVDPVMFLTELVKALGPRLNMLFGTKGEMDACIYRDIELIQLSILKLIKLSREITKIDKQTFSVLGRCFTADLSIPKNQDMVMLAFDIVLEALQPAAYGKPQPYNVYEAVDANLIIMIDTLLLHLTDPSFIPALSDTKSSIYCIFSKAIFCITIMSGKSTPRALDSLVVHSSFIHHLIHYLYLDNLERHPAVSLQVLTAFKLFLQEEKLFEVAVNCGILMFCLYIVILHDSQTKIDTDIIRTAESCVELLAGIDSTFTPPKTVTDAMTQLLTPGLMKSLRNHQLLTDIRSSFINSPILIWNCEMANVLIGLLEIEIDKVMDTTSTRSAYWNAQAFCHPDSYVHVYKNLLSEIIVDEVFLDAFLQEPDIELYDPTPEHLLKALLVSVAQLESSQDVGFRQDKSVFIERLLTCLKSILALLTYHNELYSVFIHDLNIRKLFILLRNTTLGSDVQDTLLSLLEISVSIPDGCTILSPFIPDLRIVLETRSNETQMSVLFMLKAFITTNNSEVIHLIMSSALILKLLDMFLMFEDQYDGNVQEKAVHIIGLMIQSDQGELVGNYLSALFNPLFNPGNEKYAILMNCSDYPEPFIECVNDDCFTPTIYWNKDTREDLLNFLRKETRTMRTNDALYEYSYEEVTRRIKSCRVTINQQLVVENIFIYQYIDYPMYEMEAAPFVNGVINELMNRLPTLLNNRKDSEDFAALVQSLNLFLKSNTVIEPSLYTTILSFYIKMIRDNIDVAQESIIQTVEDMAKQTAGLVEFIRNNRETTESSYIVDLLAASYLISNREHAFRLAEVIRSVITQDSTLLNTCFAAGVLFYAFYFIFADVNNVDRKDSLANIYLLILQHLIMTLPATERDALQFTTSLFRGHFRNDASIFKAFIKKAHEAPVEEEENTVRVWSDESREAVMKAAEQMILRLNSESYMNANWDRLVARSTLDEIVQVWKKHVKVVTVNQKFSEESTAIKLRNSTFARPSPSGADHFDFE